MKALLAALTLLFAASCVSDLYNCSRNEQCSSGHCEPSGFCSFADSTCASGYRYERFATARLSGQCVVDNFDLRSPDDLSVSGDLCSGSAADPANCGSCGHACMSGEVCSGGVCGCPPGAGNLCESDMGLFCTSLQSDRDNCGTCGNVCDEGQLCAQGACTETCSPGYSSCASYCAQLQTDRNNCGVCGNVCATAHFCQNGGCTTTIYLRADGDDNTGVATERAFPFRTAQGAAMAAIALHPSSTNVVLIDVGVGSFGDITLTQDFGAYINWVGVDATHSNIGNVSLAGTNGASASDDGSGDPQNGQSGTIGHSVIINGDATLTFGDINTSGGSGGDSFYGSGSVAVLPGGGLDAGNITIGANSKVGSLSANGGASGNGFDQDEIPMNDGGNGSGGIVIVATGATTDDISAQGGTTPNLTGGGGGAGSATISGSTGIVNINAGDGAKESAPQGGGVLVVNVGATTSDLFANGASGGTGGTVTMNGTAGNITADGGESVAYSAFGGAGGTITLNGHAGAVSASGNGYFGGGGTIIINGVAGAIAANGGQGSFFEIGAADGGGGGTVTINGTAGSAAVDGGNYQTGGHIRVNSGATATNLEAIGGPGIDGRGGSGGPGGTITYSLTAVSTGTKNVSGGPGDTTNGGANGAPGSILTIP